MENIVYEYRYFNASKQIGTKERNETDRIE